MRYRRIYIYIYMMINQSCGHPMSAFDHAREAGHIKLFCTVYSNEGTQTSRHAGMSSVNGRSNRNGSGSTWAVNRACLSYVYIYTYIYIYIHTYTYTCVYVCTCTYISICIYIYTSTRIYMYIYVHIHMYIYTRIYYTLFLSYM